MADLPEPMTKRQVAEIGARLRASVEAAAQLKAGAVFMKQDHMSMLQMRMIQSAQDVGPLMRELVRTETRTAEVMEYLVSVIRSDDYSEDSKIVALTALNIFGITPSEVPDGT